MMAFCYLVTGVTGSKYAWDVIPEPTAFPLCQACLPAILDAF